MESTIQDSPKDHTQQSHQDSTSLTPKNNNQHHRRYTLKLERFGVYKVNESGAAVDVNENKLI